MMAQFSSLKSDLRDAVARSAELEGRLAATEEDLRLKCDALVKEVSEHDVEQSRLRVLATGLRRGWGKAGADYVAQLETINRKLTRQCAELTDKLVGRKPSLKGVGRSCSVMPRVSKPRLALGEL